MGAPARDLTAFAAAAAATEGAIVGALMAVDRDAAAAGLQMLREEGVTPRHFADPLLAHLYATAGALLDDGAEADPVAVWRAAVDAGNAEASDLPTVSELAATGTLSGLPNHARALVRQARLRAAMRAADNLRTRLAEPGCDVDKALALARKELADTAGGGAGGLAPQWAETLGDDAQVPAQLIEGLITAAGVSCWMGQPNAGKSYLMTAAAIAVSTGGDFLGRRTQKGVVLYMAAEGGASVRARLLAHKRHTGAELGALALVAQPIDLMQPSADIDAVITLAKVAAQRYGLPCALVVVDTVARAMPGGDENTAEDMGRLIAGADRIKEATGAHVALVHHLGKDASRGARGHSSLRGAVDTEILVERDDAQKLHLAKVTKQRDLASRGEVLACKLVPVELGVDQWGNAITACAVVAVDAPSSEPKRRAMTPAQQAVMGYLNGRDRGAKRSDLATAIEVQGISRATAYRAINDLLAMGLLMDAAGQVYAPKP